MGVGGWGGGVVVRRGGNWGEREVLREWEVVLGGGRRTLSLSWA